VTAPGSTIRGLAGQVTFSRVDTVRVATGVGQERDALVTVTWTDNVTGGAVSQRYLVHLVAAEDGGWLVDAVEVGTHSPSS
jgi:hypothetical protein